MSSSTGHHEPASKGQLRRAIHRITGPFRRADSHGNATAPNFSQPSSAASPTQDAQQQTVPYEGNKGSSYVHSAPLVVAPDPNEALLAASDSASEDLSSLDPSLYAGRGSNRDIVMGEWTMDRTSAHSQRAQRLMSRYGVEIQPNDIPTPNPPTVVHRVQRAPRMRIHRACHQCGIDFSQHKKCRVCGHEICKRCPRSSGRRGEALAHMGFPSNAADQGASVSEGGSSASGLDHQHASVPEMKVIDRPGGEEQYAIHNVPSSHVHSEREDKPSKGKAALSPRSGQQEDSERQSSMGPILLNPATSQRSPLPSERNLLAQPRIIEGLERDGSNNESLSGTSNHPPARPAVSTDIQVSTPRTREAQAHNLGRPHVPIPSLVRNVRNGSSIRYLPPVPLPKAEACRAIMLDPGFINDRQQAMFPAVQRVYRKPRQRIRYMCHMCNIPLLQSNNCSKCGHNKCELCRRRPTVKDRREPDPRYVEAVERRLSSINHGLTSAAAFAQGRAIAMVGQ